MSLNKINEWDVIKRPHVKEINSSNPYAPWDLTKNGDVDIDDLLFFCWQWGLEQPLSDIYIVESNLNYDLYLDLRDFAIFANHWLESSSP